MLPEDRLDATLEAELERSARALELGHRDAAYLALRDAALTTRAPEVMATLERMSERFCEQRALAAKTQAAFVSAWLAAARTKRPWEARWLLVGLEPMLRADKFSAVASCLDELVASANDPSLGLAATRLAAIEGVSFGSGAKVLTRLFKLILAAGDVRAISALEELERQAGADLTANQPRRSSYVAGVLLERIPKALRTLRALPQRPLTPGVRTQLEALEAALAAPLREASEEHTTERDEERALAAVLADPESDAARAVWADALQLAGDPRGELIALQLAGAAMNASKITKLVQKHWRTWVGPLASAIVPASVEIDRGLLVACVTEVKRKAMARAVFSHPHWGTVRRLSMNGVGLLTSAMRSLERAEGMLDILEELGSAELPRLRELRVRERGFMSHAVQDGKLEHLGLLALAAARGLPALRELDLLLAQQLTNRGYRDVDLHHYRWLLEAPLASQLEELGLSLSWPGWRPEDLERWVATMRGLPALRRACAVTPGATLVLDFATGELSLEDLSPTDYRRSNLVGAATALAQATGRRFDSPG